MSSAQRQLQLLKHPPGARKGLTNSFSVLHEHKEGCGFGSGPQPPSLPLLPLLPSSSPPSLSLSACARQSSYHALVAATAAEEGGKHSGRAARHNEALQGQSQRLDCRVTDARPVPSVLQPGAVAVLASFARTCTGVAVEGWGGNAGALGRQTAETLHTSFADSEELTPSRSPCPSVSVGSPRWPAAARSSRRCS